MAPGAQGRRDRAGVHVRRQAGSSDIPSLLRRMARPRHRVQGPHHAIRARSRRSSSAWSATNRRRGHDDGTVPAFNRHGVWAIYRFEMARFLRTLLQSVVTPVITTSLYFVVFGSAIGSRMSQVDGVPYGAFIVPGLIMLSLFTTSISNASFGIYFPKFTGTIYELLSAPISFVEMIIAYVGAAATKSIILGLIILGDGRVLRAGAHRPPALDGGVPAPDRGHLQRVRLRDRHLGQGLRAAAVHPDADRDAADLPGRRVLFDRHAAADLAHGRARQPRRLPDQRLSLELLQHRRRRGGRQPGDDAGFPGRAARSWRGCSRPATGSRTE